MKPSLAEAVPELSPAAQQLLEELKKGRPADPRVAAHLVMRLYYALSPEEQKRRRDLRPKFTWFSTELPWLEPGDIRTFQPLYRSETVFLRDCTPYWEAWRNGMSRHHILTAHTRAVAHIEEHPNDNWVEVSRAILAGLAADHTRTAPPPIDAATTAASVNAAPIPAPIVTPELPKDSAPSIDIDALLAARAARMNIAGGASGMLGYGMKVTQLIIEDELQHLARERAAPAGDVAHRPIEPVVGAAAVAPAAAPPAAKPKSVRISGQRAPKRNLKRDGMRIVSLVTDLKVVKVTEVVARLKARDRLNPNDPWLPADRNVNTHVSKAMQTCPGYFKKIKKKRGLFEIIDSPHQAANDTESAPPTPKLSVVR